MMNTKVQSVPSGTQRHTTTPGGSGATAMDDIYPAVFRDPPCQYRGVTLWFLNNRLDPDEAEWQLRGFHQAGWGAVITRVFRGIRAPYLSPEWLAVSDRAVKVSKELGMRVFLQHADKNASGYMASGVPGMQERFRHKILTRAEIAAEPPPNSERLLVQGGYAYYWQTVVPPGQWAQLMAVLDLLDDETVRAYLAKAYAPLFERHGTEFGKTIEAVWVDEPLVRIGGYTSLPTLPWTPRLPELFQRDWGYSILSHLPELFDEEGDYRRVRYHFWRTVMAQFASAYWEPVGRWCHEHGTRFAGHLMAEDTLESQISNTGGVMPFYEHMQLPGIDHLTKNLETWPAGTKFVVTPKQCVSVANQLGRKEVLSEVYGVSDQALSFEDRKWIAEWLAVLGVNYRCYHGSFYSMTGCRKRFYPPHLSHQQPWWPENRLIADPMARLSYALRQGKYAAEILVIHPLDSAHCEYSPVKPAPILQEMQGSLAAVSENLLALHRQFDYGDDTILAKYGRVVADRLQVGEMTYRAVILPSLVSLRGSTARLLEEFLDAGGHVVSVGTLPSLIDARPDPALDRILAQVVPRSNTVEDLGGLLAQLLPPEVELTGVGAGRVWIHHRRLPGRQLLFLFNTDRSSAADTQLRICGQGRLDAWDLVSAKACPVPQNETTECICAKLRFEPGGSHLLVLEEKAAPVSIKTPKATVARSVALTGPFAVRRRDPNALTLDMCRYRRGADPWSDCLPVIGVQELLTAQQYRGPIEMEFRFAADHAPPHCELVIEDSHECQVSINGTPVERRGNDYFWDKGFKRLDVSHHVVAGENLVRIACDFVPGDATAIMEPELLYGTELEAIYVVGEFAVGQPAAGQFILSPESETVPGDLVANGYPFFAGRIVLTKELELPAPATGERVVIEIGPLQAVLAKVRVNGWDAGAIAWAPYRLDVTSAVRSGRNTVEIELITSLGNLLGPHHYTGPRKPGVWNSSFTARSECAEWMLLPRRRRLESWSDAYQFVPLGLSAQARLVYEF